MSEPVKKKQKTKESKDSSVTISPKPTLYINNIPDGLGSNKIRTNLYLLFSIYGEVIKISVKTRRQRGQAFVRMRTADEANLALISLNNELFFEKPLRVQFSKKNTICK